MSDTVLNHHSVGFKNDPSITIKPPKAAYPNGFDADLSKGAMITCTVPLTYPAPGVGFHTIMCRRCGVSSAVTCHNRFDDPRSVKLACKKSY